MRLSEILIANNNRKSNRLHRLPTKARCMNETKEHMHQNSIQGTFSKF